jgi:hypothetical protein
MLVDSGPVNSLLLHSGYIVALKLSMYCLVVDGEPLTDFAFHCGTVDSGGL